MTKRSKSYRAAAEKIHADILYTPLEAMKLAKETTVTKFDSTVEVVFRLGVDPRKADQMVRGTGPRGLMPNPKTGTVTMDVAKAIKEIKGGRIEFRIDKHSNLAFIVGKSSFTAEQLAENYGAVLDEILRLKPASAKGRYISKATVSTTMGPGIPLDATKTKNVATADAS